MTRSIQCRPAIVAINNWSAYAGWLLNVPCLLSGHVKYDELIRSKVAWCSLVYVLLST